MMTRMVPFLLVTLLIPYLLAAHVARADVVDPDFPFVATDQDVDGVIIGGGLNDQQFLAIVDPTGIPGNYFALDIQNRADADDVSANGIGSLGLGGGFTVGLFDSENWQFANFVEADEDSAYFRWNFPGDVVSAFDSFTDVELVMVDIAAVPLPAAVWLFGSGLVGLALVARKRENFRQG